MSLILFSKFWLLLGVLETLETSVALSSQTGSDARVPRSGQ
jgi:hypothetical protein